MTDHLCLVQLFDPEQDVAIIKRRLPHWSQAGTACFITWRTWDSIPQAVLATWLEERRVFLQKHGINPLAED
jgi:putative transposase